ncbi:hypothetical protein VTL71DRAFT_1135 [Oculimacula yallundae]|uniref:Heterokaryon incompatibility domain-containing protein n=1 Tax=Oculimacula yallundae TaxID=86028 RepID=A0ABR4D250_9HELO
MALPQYQHDPITSPGTFRLIRLKPSASLEAELHCDLIHVTIEACTQDIVDHYIALSYVWGDPSLDCSIGVNGQPLAITASLHCALRYIRDDKRVVRIWADGICINQMNIEDRNVQVAMMGSIYSGATHTIIFLGEPTPELELTMQMLQSAGINNASGELPPGSSGLSMADAEKALSTSIEDNILCRPWFSRVWVLQELVLSISPWIQGGKFRVKWDEFSRLVSRPGSQDTWQPDSRSLMDGMCNIRRRFQARNLSRKDPNWTQTIGAVPIQSTKPHAELYEMLVSRRGSGVTDPRDMLFAHLGLTSNFTQRSISIDYSKTIAEVYEEITILSLENDENLSILSDVEEAPSRDRREGLPSWVVDWQRTGKIKQDGTQVIAENSRLASQRRRSWYGKFIRPVTAIPHVLAIVGWDLGRVASIVSPSSWPVISFHEDSPSKQDYTPEGALHGIITEWVGDSEERAPAIFLAFLERHVTALLPSWTAVQALDRRKLSRKPNLSRYQNGDPRVRFNYSVPGFRISWLQQALKARFPVAESRNEATYVSRGKKKHRDRWNAEEFLLMRETLADIITLYILNALESLLRGIILGQRCAILESGHFAQVPAKARVGHHIFRTLGEDRMLLLEEHQADPTLRERFPVLLEICGTDLENDDKAAVKQKPVQTFKLVASTVSCEVYDGDMLEALTYQIDMKSGLAEKEKKETEALRLITLH